jgi:tetratricopeptide (TPR) repeat protein
MASLAAMYAKQFEFTIATHWSSRALAFCNRPENLQNPEMALIIVLVAQLPFVKGEYSQAERLYGRALRLTEQLPDVSPVFLAHSLEAHGQCLMSLGRFTQALRVLERGFEVSRRSLGLNHIQTWAVGAKLAIALLYAGRADQADALIAECVSKLEELAGNQDIRLSIALMAQAAIAMRQKRHREAESLSLRSIDIGDKIFSPEHPEMILARRQAAELMFIIKRKDRAKQLLTEAEAAERRVQMRTSR